MVDIIRRVTIEGVSRGMDGLASDLKNIAVGESAATAGAKNLATATEIATRKMLSARAAYEGVKASLDSVYRGQIQLEAAQRKVNAAFEQGIMVEAEKNRMLQLLEARYNSVTVAASKAAAASNMAASSTMVSGMGAVGGPALANQLASEDMIARMSGQMGKLGQSTKLTAFEVTNLGMQFNDIAVMMASGQNPMVMMMQQGMQVAQIMMMTSVATQGLKATLVALGNAVKTFLTNPFFLAVVAITAVIGAIWLLVRNFRTAVVPLKDAIDSHTKSVENLKRAYEDAANAVLSFGRESTEVFRFMERQAAEALQKSFESELENILKQMGRQLSVDIWEGLDTNSLTTLLTAYEALRTSIDMSEADILKFREILVSIGKENQGNELIKKLVNNMLALSDALVKVQRQLSGLDEFEKFLRDVAGWFSDLPGMLDKVNTSAAQFRAEIQSLYALTVEERAAAAAARARADALSGGVTELEEIEIARVAALERAMAEKEITDALHERMLAMQGNLAAAQNEFKMIGQTVGEQTRLRVEYELMQAAIDEARAQGGLVSPEEIAAIKEAAGLMGDLATATAQVTLQYDLLFERAQLARDEIDQAVAATLHGAGLAMDDVLEPQVRYNEELKHTVDIMDEARGTAKSFFGELIRGGDAIGVLADKLMDLGLDLLVSGLMGPPGTTGSGPLGSILQTIFGPGKPPPMPEIANVANMQIAAAEVILNTPSVIPYGTGVGSPAFSGLVPIAPLLPSQGNAPVSPVTSVDLPPPQSLEVPNITATFGAPITGQPSSGAGGPGWTSTAAGTIAGVPLATWEQEAYAAAVRGGIDPNVFLDVLRSEGLQPNIWQSIVGIGTPYRETSYGPGQFLVGGGLGDVFQQQTGLDLTNQAAFMDPMARQQYLDFMIQQARLRGWEDWHGAANTGIGRWEGIPSATIAQQSSVQNIPAATTTALENAAAQSAQAVDTLAQSIGSLEAPLNTVIPSLGDFSGAISQVGSSIFGSGGAAPSSSVFTAIASGFGGLFQHGGELGAGRWGIAGEAGPELIHGPASITPVHGGNGAPRFNVNIKTQEGVSARITRAEQNDSGDFDLEVFAEAIEHNIRDKYNLKQTPPRWGRI